MCLAKMIEMGLLMSKVKKKNKIWASQLLRLEKKHFCTHMSRKSTQYVILMAATWHNLLKNSKF